MNSITDYIKPLFVNVVIRFPSCCCKLFICDCKLSIVVSFVSVSFFLIYYYAIKPLSKRVFFFSGIIFFLLMIFMLIVTHSSNNYFSAKDNSRAVIYEDVVNIMSAPNENSMNLFSLHIGTTVQVKEVEGNWLKVKIDNGNEGWIKKIKVRII